MRSIDFRKAVDLSHHLNVRQRQASAPLKGITKFMAYDGMLSLAGGT